MTIRPGAEWGREVEHDRSIPSARTERRLTRRWERGSSSPIFLASGSLRLALGLRWRGRRQRVEITCDLLVVGLERGHRRRSLHALGNVVVCERGVRPRMHVISNTGWWARRRITPRAHPNDGLLDVLVVSREIGWAQRLRGLRRARRLDHLPHPGLAVSRDRTYVVEDRGVLVVWVDGRFVGFADRIEATVIPDAIEVRA